MHGVGRGERAGRSPTRPSSRSIARRDGTRPSRPRRIRPVC